MHVNEIDALYDEIKKFIPALILTIKQAILPNMKTYGNYNLLCVMWSTQGPSYVHFWT